MREHSRCGHGPGQQLPSTPGPWQSTAAACSGNLLQPLSFPRGNHLITAHHCNYHGTQRDSPRPRWAGSCRAASAQAGSVPAVCELWCTHGTVPTAGNKALLRDPTAPLLPKLCLFERCKQLQLPRRFCPGQLLLAHHPPSASASPRWLCISPRARHPRLLSKLRLHFG